MNSIDSSAGSEGDAGQAKAIAGDDLVLDLRAEDFPGGSIWPNRVRGGWQVDAEVPPGVRFDSEEKAFVFQSGGDVMTVPLATNPVAMQEASYAVWVKVLEPLKEGQLGWFIGQSPEYGWSRALALNDFRLGYIGITTSTHWDSKLGRAPVGSWLHVVGVWRQAGRGTVYLNGVRGATTECRNGTGCDPAETLIIGGRIAGDPVHNPAIAISDVSVYSKALNDGEVRLLFAQGRSGRYATNGAEAAEGNPTTETHQSHAVPPQLPPTWDEEARLFWFPTGINAYDLPDGREWQRQFKAALEKSKPPESKRSLVPRTSEASPPPSPLPPRGRRLSHHPSDPEKLARRQLHSTALKKMPIKSGVALRVQDQRIALFRFGQSVFAVDAACPHQGGSLVEGEVGDIEDMVEGTRCYVVCPIHKFQFDLSTGDVLHGKCPQLPTYKVRMREVHDNGDKFAMVEVGFESLSAEFFVEYDADDF